MPKEQEELSDLMFDDKSEGEQITLDDLGDAAKASGNSTGKPVFDKNTLATVEETQLQLLPQVLTTTDDSSKYKNILLKVKCVTDDGQTTWDNYSGLHQDIGDDHLWCTSKSQFGKLRLLILEELGDDASWTEVIEYLDGKKVKIKTEESHFQGKTYQKNMIKQIL